jgi:hypothetical protein
MPAARWRSTTSATAAAVRASNSGVDCSVKPSSARVRALASMSAAVRGRLPEVVVGTAGMAKPPVRIGTGMSQGRWLRRGGVARGSRRRLPVHEPLPA